MSSTLSEETLGKVLKQARKFKKLSLRSTEEITEISNSYLSQLESDKIKKPSADILHKLSNAYKLDFNYLLRLAGLVEKADNDNVSFGRFVFSKQNLNKEEEEELIRYLHFIRERKSK